MEIRDKIIKITGLFGMPAKVAGKAMGVKEQSFRNKLNTNSKSDNFTKNNLDNLKAYIKEKAKEIEDL